MDVETRAAVFLSEGAPDTWDSAFFVRQREQGVTAFEIPNWSPAFIAAAHANRMAVYVYTVNDESTMKALIEAGADGIETDVPRLAIRVARELGVRPRASGVRDAHPRVLGRAVGRLQWKRSLAERDDDYS